MIARRFGLILLFSAAPWTSWSSWASEGMPGMPSIRVSKVYPVPSTEAGNELFRRRGFGALEPEVRMMNLMMVEGSGMEGMEMSSPAPAARADTRAQGALAERYDVQAALEPASPRVGSHVLTISVRDAKTGKPSSGLELRATVAMTSMNMGEESPAVTEIAPGRYRAAVEFSMRGPWAVRLRFQDGFEKTLSFDVAP